MTEAEVLLTEFVVDVFDDDCWTDHHGNCQAHFLQPVEGCIVRRARRLLGLDIHGFVRPKLPDDFVDVEEP